MSNLVVVAKVVAKKGFLLDVKSSLLNLVAPTRLECGCIDYALHQDNDDLSVFVFYETWENLSCLDNHLQSDHYLAHARNVKGMIEDKEVFRLTRVDG
jgi:quinol monooxygenase YgiN